MVKGLSQRRVDSIRPGQYADGRGLWLVVESIDIRRWELRFKWRNPDKVEPGRPRRIGLGNYPEVGLLKARDLADEARRMISEGIDPLLVAELLLPDA